MERDTNVIALRTGLETRLSSTVSLVSVAMAAANKLTLSVRGTGHNLCQLLLEAGVGERLDGRRWSSPVDSRS